MGKGETLLNITSYANANIVIKIPPDIIIRPGVHSILNKTN